jgi:Rrf2 family nitric oxide-sensitive transcriptional repressor
MRLLLCTDYALRALIYVGAHPRAPVPSSAIAAAYGISVDHVAKATKTLTRHGFLRATRGATGGVALARGPEEIRLGDVVRLFEHDRGVAQCLRDGGPRCRIERGCRLRRVLERAEARFYAELDGCTLADVLLHRPQLVRLLRARPTAS